MITNTSVPIACVLALGLLALDARSAAAQLNGPALSAAINRELAAVRSATARYHDVAQAEADGYVNINLYEPGEGFHWVKPSLVDGVFEAERPEILLYAQVAGENRLQLVAVEYIVPLTLSPGAPPSGFTGTADEWREDTETFGMWELTVWIWEHNPSGMFKQHNPRVP
jgi:hypothetical protein